jgi:hypothetical protein
MIAITVPLFMLACLRAVSSPGFALALVASMFTIKQLLQASVAWLSTSYVGTIAINAIVLATSIVAIIARFIRRGHGPRSGTNLTAASAIGIFAWSVVTCAWTPSETAWEAVQAGLPYFVLLVVIAPRLVCSWSEAAAFHQGLIWVGIPTAILILVSPEFTTKYGRLGLDIGGTRTNPLALGQFGGLMIIAAALYRRPGTVIAVLRTAAMVLGAALAIRSGSRGQFLYAVIVAIGFFPLAASVRNIKVFLLTAIGVFLIAFISFQLVELLLENPLESRRFSFEEMLFGRSSAAGRFANVRILYEAWLSEPMAPMIGLGYNAFEYYAGTAGEPYSHVIFADAIFELGFPGALLMATFVSSAARSAIRLSRSSSDSGEHRLTCAMLLAWFAYEVLLANKQGSLWGTPAMFPAGIVLTQVTMTESAASASTIPAPDERT